MLAENLTICEEWELSIDLKLPRSRSETEWRKVFSVQANGITDWYIPTVWIRPNQLSVMFSHNSFKNFTVKNYNEDNWVNLKISQINGEQKVKVDYKLVYKKTNSLSKTWTNVNLVTGNTYGKKNASTKTQYRNFDINTCKTKGEHKQ